MRIIRTLTLGLCSSAALLAQETQPERVALHCGKLYVGNGQVMTKVYLVVKDGKIERLSRSKPEGVTVVDASDKVVMPGIVAADTSIGAPRDDRYNVTPDFVALNNYDFLGNYRRALSGGVTTAYLSPGRQRFVSGQGSVVKLHGDDIVRRVLAEKAFLRITLGDKANTAPRVFEPTVQPTSDDPLVPARQQFPSSRISQLNELRRIFQRAQTDKDGVDGKGAAEDRYRTAPLRAAASGKLPLRVAAEKAADLRNALRFAKEIGAGLVLESPHEVGNLLALHQGADLRAVFRLEVRPGAQNPGDNRPDEAANRPENAVLAVRNGMTVALAPARDADFPDFLLVAGLAIRLGLSEEQALKAITLDAAKVLGVDQRVGSLEPGKDADILVLSGDPFAVGTMVEDTFVDGKHAFHREKGPEVMVIKARRIVTLEGQAILNGSIVVADGKIRGIGQDQSVPYGARVVDMGDSTIVPGFIDAYCHAGLSQKGLPVPAGKPSHRLTEVIDPKDPVLRQLSHAGLTTVMVSGRDSGTVSGRVAAIKTGAEDRSDMVVKDIAGIRFRYDATTPKSFKSVSGQIERAKAYIAKWQKYEKDLETWKNGGAEKPKPKAEKKPEPKKEEKKPKAEDKISGNWSVRLIGAPFPIGFNLRLELQDDDSIKGGAQLTIQGRARSPMVPLKSGKWSGGEFELELGIGLGRGGASSSTLKGKPEGDKLVGNYELGSGRRRLSGNFEAVRGSGAPAPRRSGGSSIRRSKKPDDGRPKPPDIDDNLEPMRALLQKQIPAVITTSKAPAIRAIVEWFEEKKLPYILQGAEDAVDTPEILGEAQPGMLFTPAFLERKGRKVENAAARMSQTGLPVGLVSGDTAGARYLPLHAALAVRYGMDPSEALKAITLYPAKMFKIDDRVGSLKRGKDADFVVLSGSPLEMTSKVQMVVVNGRIVIDNRNDGSSK